MIHMCIYNNHFAVHLKFTQYYKSIILQLKKKQSAPIFLVVRRQFSFWFSNIFMYFCNLILIVQSGYRYCIEMYALINMLELMSFIFLLLQPLCYIP